MENQVVFYSLRTTLSQGPWPSDGTLTYILVRVNKASSHQKNLDVGANLFVGNLDPEIDEKLLYDTFSAFGVILQTPKIMRDPDTGNSKGT